MIDFNEETTQHAKSVLESVRRNHRRSTQIEVTQKSVNQILKEAAEA